MKTPWFTLTRRDFTQEFEERDTYEPAVRNPGRATWYLTLRGCWSEAVHPIPDDPESMNVLHHHPIALHCIPADVPTLTYVVVGNPTVLEFTR